jgi:LysM repeat protein
MPAVIAGSIALTLTGAPAHAASEGRMPRVLAAPDLPTPRLHAVSLRVAAGAIPETVTVQPGDTVSAIAGRHGLGTAEVLALNGLTGDSTIFPGQVLRLTGGPTTSAAPAEHSVPTDGSYAIQTGDTITAIAQRHGVTVQAILDANALTRASIIYPGQTITIPGAMVAASATTPAPVAIESAAPALPVTSGGQSYVIRAGDTVSGIAQLHGVTTQAILGANGLERASIIYPGQTLTIPGTAAPASPPPVSTPATTGLDAEQTANAALIIAIGRELGVPDKGIAVALGTAMQESWLRNLDWGDRDSLGLFQQRPSTGWGSPDEVRDPARATRAFFGGASDPNGSRTRGLLDVSGWEAMSFADAAQAVQISAYPDRYAAWEQPAWAWLAALG